MSSGKLAFWLTRSQAEALARIYRGERLAAFMGARGRPFMLDAFYRNGLIASPSLNVDRSTLTELGKAAAQLAELLVRRQKRPTDG